VTGQEWTVNTTEANKSLARRIIEEMWNTRNLWVIEDVYAPSPDGREGTRQFVAAYLATFPDLHNTIMHQIADGDWVATRYTSTGTHLVIWRTFHSPGSSSPWRGSKRTASPTARSLNSGTALIR
jgi:predicted SnoaL-like aldol condensation-catalyzing enzyme